MRRHAAEGEAVGLMQLNCISKGETGLESIRGVAACLVAHAARRLQSPVAQAGPMATYRLNERALARARDLIERRQYVLDSDWGEAQPRAADENRYLESHTWDDYAAWHLGLTDGAPDGTKARYAFVYGDLRRVHRTGIIACHFRAAEWRHKEIELAAHELLQLIDRRAPRRPGSGRSQS
jgi:hypothetical protein